MEKFIKNFEMFSKKINDYFHSEFFHFKLFSFYNQFDSQFFKISDYQPLNFRL